MSAHHSLITHTSNPLLEQALRDKLQRRAGTAGTLGELEPLAIRLGLIQNTLKPRFETPQLVILAADHGLVVDGVGAGQQRSTAQLVHSLLAGQQPVSVFARIQGLTMTVVDAGVADPVAQHPQLLARKIAHGTRNARVTAAMSLDQAQAAIRAGMEIGGALDGNLVACAGIGVGAQESAALVLSRLTQSPVRELVISGPDMSSDTLSHLMAVLQGALGRHRSASDPVEVLAAFGGFEVAMMVGLMLVSASKRKLVMADGLPACAALMVASLIAPAVTDHCLFCRSHGHHGLDQALALFHASALLELGMESIDGTGASLAYPLVRSAAALLAEVAEGEDPGPTLPGDLGPPESSGPPPA